jgi:Cu-Zn family superoxide dismutase
MKSALLALAVLACAGAASAQTQARVLHIDPKDAAGNSIAHAMVTEAPDGVLVYIEVYKLPAGFHGLHFHEKGVYTAPAFTSAGGHVHMGGERVHGFLNPQHNEAGDLPNLFIGRDGTGHAQFFARGLSFDGKDGKPALVDADGSALVIHAQADDFQSQPIGGSGDRIACGVLARDMSGAPATSSSQGHEGH